MKTFIIAEAGANHDKNFDQALKLIDVAKESGADACKFQTYSSETLYVKNTPNFAGYQNINKLIKDLKVPKNIGILSLDIDGIDFWILKEIKDLNPSIIICEFNPLFGKHKSITVPYKKNFIRKKEHSSNLYFGA